MKFDSSIFKSYDIRGEYPVTINEEVVKAIGASFVRQFKVKSVALGRDGRLSSPLLLNALSEGIRSEGSDVVDLGIVTTDMVYFASGYYEDIDAGIMITASHNPSKYNGLKFCLKNAMPVNGDDLEAVKTEISGQFSTKEPTGSEISRDIYEDYGKKILEIAGINGQLPLKIAIDAGNGVAGEIFEKAFSEKAFFVSPLFFEIDGAFPNHPANPIEEKNLTDLKTKVLTENASFGIAFDGDGDRAFFVDEKGKSISSTLITAMIADYFLKIEKGSTIIHSLLCGNIVKETIENSGGNAIISRVGHSHIKKIMREQNAIFGGEHSGHYYYRDLYFADSGILTSMIVAKIVSESKQPLSELTAKYDKYFLSGEINFEVKDAAQIINELKNKFKDGKQRELDGLTVTYPDWRFNVRASNTEPVLRLNIEADNKELMERKRDNINKLINFDN